jgi:serine/threonine protein kinase/tetratricopeptide (TPR) repeat protein
MSESTAQIRCGLSFKNQAEFLKVCGQANRELFVPYPDELNENQTVYLDVFVGEDARLELIAQVLRADFDEAGSTGVQVKISEASRLAVKKIAAQLQSGLRSLYETARIDKRTFLDEDAPSLEESLIEPGTVIDERFRIEAHIASGGMGHVYRANHVHLNRLVALKLLKRAFATESDMWTRFKREAELVSQLESQHVVRVFDFGKTKDGQPFLAMEYVEGQTLEGMLTQGPVPLDEVARIIREIGTGLAEAHALGVVHRDLKPANIMMGKRRDGTPLAKILDFGIARLADGEKQDTKRVTKLGLVVGTPAYLSPEQALADSVDARTDIYALGCVVYELLTGTPPFRAESLQKIVAMHLTKVPDDPAEKRPDLATFPGLSRVVLKALEKEKANRFSKVMDFVEAIEVALGVAEGPAFESDAVWPPANAPLPQASAELPGGLSLDDFFGAAPLAVRPLPVASRSSIQGARPPMPWRGELLDKICDEMALHRSEARDRTKSILAHIDILGPKPHSHAWQRGINILGERLSAAHGYLASAEQTSCVAVFASTVQSPLARAALALSSAHALMSEEGLQADPPYSIGLRAGLVAGENTHELSQNETAQRLVEDEKPGAVVCGLQLKALAFGSFECRKAEGRDAWILGPHKVYLKPSDALVGREEILEIFDRRLLSLQQGVAAALMVRGATGSGRSVLAQALADRARKQNCVVATTSGVLSPSPFSAITDLLCGLLGVPYENRDRLRGEFQKLNLPEHLIEATLVVAGSSPLPIFATPGQAAYVLRAILQLGAQSRPTVLVFDGLEKFDPQSIETFAELLSVPAARELCVGFATPELSVEKLNAIPAHHLEDLSPNNLESLIARSVNHQMSPPLLKHLMNRVHPGAARAELARLEDTGALGINEPTGGTRALDFIDNPVSVARDKLNAWPGEFVNLFEAALVCGEAFDGQLLSTAWPRTNASIMQRAATVGAIRQKTPRRWRMVDQSMVEQVIQRPSHLRAGMHRRLAQAQVEQGRVNSAAVDPAAVAKHCLLGGDGLRASQLLKHLVEMALAQRNYRRAFEAARDFSRALGLLPNSEQLLPTRLDALARAAGMALVMQDATSARALVDEGFELAKARPSAELTLSAARVFRSEARRAKASQMLEDAEKLALNSPLGTLVLVERSEVKEIEGDAAQAKALLETALKSSDAAFELAQWHGEVHLTARIEARLGGLLLQAKELPRALKLLESSLARYKTAKWPFAQGRVLMNLGTLAIFSQRPQEAATRFAQASLAAASCGDLLFQARALLAQAKALKKVPAQMPLFRAVVAEVRSLCLSIGWQQGREEAGVLFQLT